MIRQFLARHPVLTDSTLAIFFFLFALVPAGTFRAEPGSEGLHPAAIPVGVGTLVICLLLLRRRQWPIPVFIASFVLSGVLLFAPSAVGTPVVFLTAYSLAVYRSTRAAWIGWGAAIAALVGVSISLVLGGRIDSNVAINTVISDAFLSLLGVLIGTNVGNRRRYFEAVIDRSRQLLREIDQQARIGAAAERTRIAREMHDIVSHSLTVIVALTEGAAATVDPEKSRAASAHAARSARAALTEMRAMLGVLRSDDEDAPRAPADYDALTDVIASAQQAGFPVTLRQRTMAAQVPPPLAIKLAMARVVQESLTNAMRHAPRAGHITVTITQDATQWEILVENDGAPVPSAPGGYGLRGIRERVALAGGQFAAGLSAPGVWTVRATLPMPPSAPSALETPRETVL